MFLTYQRTGPAAAVRGGNRPCRTRAFALPCAALPAAALLIVALATTGCDRNVEPYSDEPVVEPDLSRIFPEAADRGREGAPPVMPPPPGATAGRGGGAIAPNAAAAGQMLRGVIEAAPAIREAAAAGGGVLFVIARVAEGAPPVAVLRIPNPAFPLNFEIGPQHRMIQQMPFTGPFMLSARLDRDGNAGTRGPDDLQGAAEGVHGPGARGIRIVLSGAP